MSHKHHIRSAFPGMEQPNIGKPPKFLIEILPLHKRSIARRLMKIPGHPRVDDVIYVIKLRRAHQVSWFAEMG
jgi:hypothetical protein